MEDNINKLSIAVIESINDIFLNIFSTVDNGIYELLDDMVFIDTKIIERDNFVKLFGDSSSSGLLLVCNSLVAGIFLSYIVLYLFSHITYSKVQPPVFFIFKSIIFVILMNESLWICKQIIHIISLISGSICEIGQELFNEEISFANFIVKINDNIYISNDQGIDVTSFDGIIKTFTTIGFMNLIFSYSLRYVMIQVFTLLFPFSIILGIFEKTVWISKSLLKAFFSLLLEQVLISIILVLAFSLSFSLYNNLSKILFLGIIYGLMKSNTYMYMIFGGITTSVSNNFNIMKGGR